ncbi:MAG: hypothetical protein R2827_15095, partial [Bdellovibrionales bacterium]
MNKNNQPTRDQIFKIIDKAKFAPHADNTQAFTFHWNGTTLEINCNSDRDAHTFNPNNFVTYINLGATTEYIAMAASEFGYKANLKLNSKEYLNATGKIGHILFKAHTSAQVDPLMDHLTKRTTDRRSFNKGNIIDISKLIHRDIDLGNVQLHAAPANHNGLRSVVFNTESTIFDWKQARQDVLKWVRLTQKQVYATRDGLPFFNLGMNALDVIFMKGYAKLIRLQNFLTPLV